LVSADRLSNPDSLNIKTKAGKYSYELLSQLQLIPQPLQKLTEVAIDLKMADKKIYQASTTAPVNIAVVK
jgi:hypothetical protein